MRERHIHNSYEVLVLRKTKPLPPNPTVAPEPKDLLKTLKQLRTKKKGGEKISQYTSQTVWAATGITSLFAQKLNPVDTGFD